METGLYFAKCIGFLQTLKNISGPSEGLSRPIRDSHNLSKLIKKLLICKALMILVNPC